jgi:hypothetical protein
MKQVVIALALVATACSTGVSIPDDFEITPEEFEAIAEAIPEDMTTTLPPTTTTTTLAEVTTTTTEAAGPADEYLQAATCLGYFEAATTEAAQWLVSCMAVSAERYSHPSDPLKAWCNAKAIVATAEGGSPFDSVTEKQDCIEKGIAIDYVANYLDARIVALLAEEGG